MENPLYLNPLCMLEDLALKKNDENHTAIREFPATNTESPLFGLSSYEEAVGYFKTLGFQVEEGPEEDEVTLILNAPDYRTYGVYPVKMLAQMAAVAWRARFVKSRKCVSSGLL